MPRKRVGGKVRIADYGTGHILHLRSGHDYLGTGFGQSPDLIEMKYAWAELKDQVLAADQRHWGLFHRPWAYWRFEKRMDRPPDEKSYLISHGFLTPQEKEHLS